MSHSHDHTHHGHHARNRSFGSLFRVFLLSGLFMVAEIIGGLWSGSLALLADSGHMAIDTAAVGLGMFALWVARKPPTVQRTYGYYRAEILAATLNGALLVIVAFWILFEAWHRFGEVRVIDGSLMTAIAVGGLAVNLIGLFWLQPHHNAGLNMRAVNLHLISDALGSAGAIVAGVLVWGWNWVWADSLVSVLIALLIFRGAYRLLLECVDILLESVPAGMDLQGLRAGLLAVSSVTDVHDLHVWTLSSGVVALSAHLRIREGADHSTVLRASILLLHDEHGIDHATLQLEPEAYSHEDTHLECQKMG